ncbi:MAG TPA: autotransporter-associated beta strand repeat-containing protein, partial [Verrucomicrobiae bacterium]|nr:autotransporter-associated beta strand repeat-containing protein [Verrucomicrobiae bacterium]
MERKSIIKTNFKTTVPGVRPAKPSCSSSGTIPAGRAVLCGWCILLLLAFSAQGKTLTWSGSAVPNANWSVSANWGGVGTPANGDTLIFSGSHTNSFLNTNNIISLSLSQIQFVGDNTFGVMFDLRGNAFTLTGSILATNATGTNIIENNITVANASELIVVSNSDQLIIKGVLSGSGGVTKAGAGTLTYQCSGNNTYNGTTLVNGGTLQFNVSGEDAVSGPLVIGDGSGDFSAVVEDLQNTEMNGGPSVTINLNGELNLNNFSEPFFSTSLTINQGTIATLSGTLTLSPNTTVTVEGFPYVYGHLNLNGGVLTLQGNGFLYLICTMGGNGNILQTGNMSSIWIGANTYSGNYTANGTGYVALYNSQALGNVTNAMTLNGTASAFVDSNVNVT